MRHSNKTRFQTPSSAISLPTLAFMKDSEWTIQSHDSSHELANRPFLGEICRKTRGILKVNVISKITRDSWVIKRVIRGDSKGSHDLKNQIQWLVHSLMKEEDNNAVSEGSSNSPPNKLREVVNSPVSHLKLCFTVAICHNSWVLRNVQFHLNLHFYIQFWGV